MKDFEHFLEKARQRQEPEAAGAHLSEALLVAYIYEQLLDEQAGRVAAHLIRCKSCQRKVTELRAERTRLEESMAQHLPAPMPPAPAPRWRKLLISAWQAFQTLVIGQRRVLLHAGAYAGAVLIFFWANSWLENYLTPPPGGTARRPPWWAPVIWYAPWVLVPWGVGLGFYVLYRWQKKRRS